MNVIEKPKLQKGVSYVLKTSMLQEALERAQIDCHVLLSYGALRLGGSVLEAHYWLPNAHVDHPRVYVRAGVVPSAERSAALSALGNEILPTFTAWLARILALPADSPVLHAEPYFNAKYDAKGKGISYILRG